MQQLYPWVSGRYFYELLYTLLSDHGVEFLLGGHLVGDMIKLEILFSSLLRFDHQLVLVFVRHVHPFGVTRLAELGSQTDDYFHSLLSVNTTSTTHNQIIIKSRYKAAQGNLVGE